MASANPKDTSRCSHVLVGRKRKLTSCLLLGSLVTLTFQRTHGGDNRRRPPPPPPRARQASNTRKDSWQFDQPQNEDPYSYTKYSGKNLQYYEETHQQAERFQQLPDDPYAVSDTGWSNTASVDQVYPQLDQQPYDRYYDDNESGSQVLLSDGTVTQNTAPRTNVPPLPIHYNFPAAKVIDSPVGAKSKTNRIRRTDDIVNDDSAPTSASARRDLVTQYWSTKIGKAQIMISSTLLGMALGNFLGKSLLGSTEHWITVTGLTFWICTLFRTPLGELIRAAGLSMILVLQRSRDIRRTYPTWRYIPAALGLRSKQGLRPFPPARNPWNYVPRSSRDPDFNMLFVLASMAFVGSMVGGNLPLIPTWIGSLVGAACFAFACTWQTPRGDLARSCGMRVVSAVGELWEIQADLQIIPKATVVSSQIIDKVMILDRKHRVKDRFLSLANKGYEQASKLATQIHEQQRGGVGTFSDERSPPNDRDRDRRPRNEDDGRRVNLPAEERDGGGSRRRVESDIDRRARRDRQSPPRRSPSNSDVNRNHRSNYR